MSSRRGDLLTAVLAAGFVLLLSEAVYHLARTNPPPDRVAVGILADAHHIQMGAVYGSFARESGEGGGLLMHNHQTGEPHAATLARPWEWLVGRLSIGLGLPPRAAFHLERRLAVIVFACGLTLLSGAVLRPGLPRRLLPVAAMFGGSLYWVVELTGRGSTFGLALRTWLDRFPDPISGLGFAYPALLLGVPHLALEVGAFSLTLALQLAAGRRDSAAMAAAAGAAGLLLCAVRPYTVPVVLATALAVWAPDLARRDRRRRGGTLLALASTPSLLLAAHYAAVVLRPSVFSSLDVIHRAPPLHQQLFFFGLPAVAATALLAPGVRRRCAGSAAVNRVLWAWGLGCLLLVHGDPVVTWEVEALLPLPLLALVLAARAGEALPVRARRLVVWSFVLAHSVPGFFYAGEVARHLRDAGSQYWVTRGEQAALEWLENRRPPSALTADAPAWVVACAPRLGPLVPWLAGVRVYRGHFDHAADSQRKIRRLEAFYRTGVGTELVEGGVTHVLWGPGERRLAGRSRLPGAPAAAFEEADIRIFRLRDFTTP